MDKRFLKLALCLLVGVVVLVSSGCASSGPAPTQTFKIKATSYGAETYPIRVAFEKWIALVKQRSGGRIDFDYYPGETLYPLTKAGTALHDNAIQSAIVSASSLKDQLGMASEAHYLPWGWDPVVFTENWRKPAGMYEWFAPQYEAYGLKLLSFIQLGTDVLITRAPVTKPEDLKGKLIQAPSGATTIALEAIGAKVVQIPDSEQYTALERGTVDGISSSPDKVLSFRFHEVAKHVADFDFRVSGIPEAMNLEFYKSLPPDLQKIVVESFIDVEKEYLPTLKASIDAATAKLKGQTGVQWNTWSVGDKGKIRGVAEPTLAKYFVERYGEQKWNTLQKALQTVR